MRSDIDSRFRQLLIASFALLVALALAVPASAVPTGASFENLAPCDSLSGSFSGHELGFSPPFPGGPAGTDPDEEISANYVETAYTPCIGQPDTGVVNAEITMLNLTQTDWTYVWYVADPETSLQNYDGLANGELAFKIDAVGNNTPLVSESMTADGIFESGELWTFVIQDYSNTLGLSPAAFYSIGIAGASAGDTASSGSIIVAIPEPSVVLIVGVGLIGLAINRRRRKR